MKNITAILHGRKIVATYIRIVPPPASLIEDLFARGELGGIELSTFRTAVERSTTELHGHACPVLVYDACASRP